MFHAVDVSNAAFPHQFDESIYKLVKYSSKVIYDEIEYELYIWDNASEESEQTLTLWKTVYKNWYFSNYYNVSLSSKR